MTSRGRGSPLSLLFVSVASPQEIEELLNSRRFAYFVFDPPALVGFIAHIRSGGGFVLLFPLRASRGCAVVSSGFFIGRDCRRGWDFAVEVHALDKFEIPWCRLQPS